MVVTCEGVELNLPSNSSLIKRAIESGQKIDFEKIDNPSALIDVILEWLSGLPSPLFPTEFYDCLFATFNITSAESRLNIQRSIMMELPTTNRAVLEKIFQFLSVILARNKYDEIVPTMFARYIFRPNSLHEQSGMALYVVKEMIVNFEIFQDVKVLPSQTSKRRLTLMQSLQNKSDSRQSQDLSDIQAKLRETEGDRGSWHQNYRRSLKLEESTAPTISQLEAEFKDWTFEDSSDGEGEDGNEFKVDESDRAKRNMALIMASKSNHNAAKNTTTDTSEYSEEDYDEDIDGSEY